MKINDTPLFIGTSGYNYDDWKGTFAPKDTSNFDLLSYYASTKLNFLELTYTFYRLPIAEKISGIADRIGDNVKLSVRLTKTFLRKTYDENDVKLFKQGLAPAVEKGKIAALFADFHHLFTASRENFDIILKLKETFSEYPLFVELTNSTWHKERFYEEFKANDIGLCTIDGPSFRGFAPYYPICSGGGAYFRLYGKNPAWLNSDERFLDYSYTDKDLKKFIKDAGNASVMAKNIFISFCNVEKGNAPKNALRTVELLNGEGQK